MLSNFNEIEVFKLHGVTFWSLTRTPKPAPATFRTLIESCWWAQSGTEGHWVNANEDKHGPLSASSLNECVWLIPHFRLHLTVVPLRPWCKCDRRSGLICLFPFFNRHPEVDFDSVCLQVVYIVLLICSPSSFTAAVWVRFNCVAEPHYASMSTVFPADSSYFFLNPSKYEKWKNIFL